MRFMLTFRFPNEKGNELARGGNMGQTIQSILEEIKPEAAYFAQTWKAQEVDTLSLTWTTPPRSPL